MIPRPDLDALRHIGDPLLDPIVEAHAPVGAWMASLREGRIPSPLAEITLPRWLDPARITRASRFYLAHAVPLSMLLGSASLLECFAARRGVRVVHAARAMRDDPGRRVGETAQFVLAMYGPGAWAPDGPALRMLLSVRLMHATVRARLARTGWEGEVPLNQEDQLGTLFAFGLTPMLHLRELGVRVDREDVEDTLHLWAAVGHVLGVRVDLWPRDEAGAVALARTIFLRHFGPSPEGRELTAALLATYARVAGDPRVHAAFLALLRVLVGGPVCDALGVPPGAGPRVGRMLARTLATSVRGWDRTYRAPGVGRLADALVPRALGWHAGRLASGVAGSVAPAEVTEAAA